MRTICSLLPSVIIFALLGGPACVRAGDGGAPVIEPPTLGTATTDTTRAPDPAPHMSRVVDADPSDYFDKKVAAIVADHRITEGNFTLTVVPIPIELHIASKYREWREKRLTNDQMLQEITTDAPVFSDSLHAMLTVAFVGDLFSGGRTQFEIPTDIADYVFLENDRGEAIRCSRAELPLMRMPGPFTKYVNVRLEFTGIRQQYRNFFDTKVVRFVVGGIGFRRNAVVYRQPFAELFQDAPTELQDLYREAEVWSGS